MNYYEIYVNYGNGGYSLGVKSTKQLTDDEIKNKLIELDLLEEKEDINNIEYINKEDESLEDFFNNITLID